MAAAIMISTFGCDNGLILAGARVYYAMARDGFVLPKNCNHESISCSLGCISGAGSLDGVSGFAAHSYN